MTRTRWVTAFGWRICLCLCLWPSMTALGQRGGAERVGRDQSDTTHLRRVTVAGPIRIRPWSPKQTVSSLESSRVDVDTLGTPQSIVASVVTGAPFSATGTTEYRVSLGDGTRIVRVARFAIYRDRFGRVRREDSTTVWIADPIAKVAYILDRKAGVAQRLPLRALVDSSAGLASASDSRGSSLSGGLLTRSGQQTIDGIDASCSQTKTSIPPGAIGNDRAIVVLSEQCWSARLRVVLSSQVHDPVQGDTSIRLSGIRTSDPDPRLFSVPTTYRILQ
jgi:hypothetical protein